MSTGFYSGNFKETDDMDNKMDLKEIRSESGLDSGGSGYGPVTYFVSTMMENLKF
jgi:hypothetical protein